ncbi:MAG: V-type ATPase subunit [Clostridiales bacterium]|nr:V-type ATPase subunit [Clostridiales bacterium]
MIDPIFTNGVIAVKERLLLGDKLLRYTEMSAEEVLRALREGGFGSGAESQEGEALILTEESSLDGFIREYAPSQKELEYLLSPRDFHNAKALCKAVKLNTDAEKLLAPEGLVKIKDLTAAIQSGDVSALGKEFGGAIKETLDSDKLTGAEIGAIFDNALFKHLSKVSKFSPLLKKLLVGRADRTNILTAMRSENREFAEKLYVCGGKLSSSELAKLFDDNRENLEKALNGTPYAEFYKLCYTAKEKGMPFTEAERALESFEAEYFVAKRYELEGKQPFLYYVFRRRAEIQNVRIILVCLNAGLKPQDIKRRLRAL